MAADLPLFGMTIPAEYVPLIAPVTAAILAPIVTTAAGVAARFGVQSRIAQAEYRLKRLDILKRALEVETAFGDRVASPESLQTLQEEYRQIVQSIAAMRPEPAAQAVVEARPKKGLRALLLPRPLTFVGWIPTVLYYLYGPFAVLYVVAAVAALVMGDWESLGILLVALVVVLAIAVPARYWALRNWDQNYAVRKAA